MHFISLNWCIHVNISNRWQSDETVINEYMYGLYFRQIDKSTLMWYLTYMETRLPTTLINAI